MPPPVRAVSAADGSVAWQAGDHGAAEIHADSRAPPDTRYDATVAGHWNDHRHLMRYRLYTDEMTSAQTKV
jgi:hypothetical protein